MPQAGRLDMRVAFKCHRRFNWTPTWHLTLCARKYLCARHDIYIYHMDLFDCNFRYRRDKWLLRQDLRSPDPSGSGSCLRSYLSQTKLEIHSAHWSTIGRFRTEMFQIQKKICNFRYGWDKWLLGQDLESPDPSGSGSCLRSHLSQTELEI